MGAPAGLLNKRVRLFRRAAMPTSVNGVRGGYEPYLDSPDHWGGFKPKGAQEYRIGGLTLTGFAGLLTLRDNPVTRSVTLANRVQIDGVMYDILSAREGEGRDGTMLFEVRTSTTRETYLREIDGKGEAMVVQRILTGGATQEAPARGMATGFQPEEISGGIQYGERRVFLWAADLAAAGWLVPVRANDKILLHGATRSLNVLHVDDLTHRIAGELFLYEIKAAG